MSDNNEESYSMYPNTPSSPPPPHNNMRFPVYQQPAAPIYMGYPQGPYMQAAVAAQTPNYHFKMMNQGQNMMYQPNPQQTNANGVNANNNSSGFKKKWNNNNAMANGTNNMMNAGNPYQNKGSNYYQSQHYYSNNLNNGQSSMNIKSNSSTAVYDPFKFDISKSNYSTTVDLTNDLPIFINTTPEEYAEARNKRYELKLDAMEKGHDVSIIKPSKKPTKIKIEKPIKKSTEQAEKAKTPVVIEAKNSNEVSIERKEKNIQHSTKETKPTPVEAQPVVATPTEKKPKHEKVFLSSKHESSEETIVEKETPIPSASTTPITTATEIVTSKVVPEKPADVSTPKPVSPPTPKTPSRSWSSIASSAVVKTKPSATKLAGSQSSDSTVNSKQPEKKDKNYVPPSTKGSEPLGSLALRMCFDPDFVNYALTNHNNNGEHKLPVNSIIPRGIINNANICFMSSVLQVLLYCKPFIDILNVVSTRNLNSRVGESSCKLLDACINIYKQFDREQFEEEKKKDNSDSDSDESKKDGKKSGISKKYEREEFASIGDAIKPDKFYQVLSKIPKFKDLQWGHQEDAEEFLTHLLDQLHEEFISCIDCLTENEIQNLLQSINDEPLKIFFIRNLQRYRKATFIENASSQFKEYLNKYGLISEDDSEDRGDEGWHEVSSSSKKGKKNKTAAKRTVEVIPSPISSLFGGQFRSVLDIPNNKESQSITLDPFQTIQLDISDPNVNDLEAAFKKFSEFELLPFKSSNGTDVEAKKQTFVDKLPQVLLIQLKRFAFVSTSMEDKNTANYNSYSGRIEKIRKKIDYPHHLTIPKETVSSHSLKYNENNRQYELYGVIYHHGVSPDGGHYTADIYHKESDKWYRIDDVNITALKPEEALEANQDSVGSRTAYILLYQKV